MKLIKEFRTETEAFQVYDWEDARSVTIMSYTIRDGGYLKHQSSVTIDKSLIDGVIEAMKAAKG